jgi:imidazolonepropionase-like amidohydrolase
MGRRGCLALVLGVWAARAGAQGPAETSAEPVWAVRGATVLPASRPGFRRGTVVWRGAKIEAVGPEIEVPAGAQVIDGEGLYVTPGFVVIGAAGLGAERTQGNVQHSLDPYDFQLRVALSVGITTAQIIDFPYFGGFAQDFPATQGANSAIIKLTHGDLKSMLVREPAVNYLALPSRQIELNFFLLRERLRKAREYLTKLKEAEEKKTEKPKLEDEVKLHVEVLKNERPTEIAAQSLAEVRVALELQREFGFDLILREPDEAWTMAAELASRRIPVLLKARGADFNFDLEEPVFEEGGMVPSRRPAAFAGAGVEVTVLPYRRGISLSGLAGRDLTAYALEAAFAVRGGLSEEDALRAITLHPARLLKLADRVGSLEKGKDADILVLSGHPFDYRTFVLKAFINGKLYYDRETSRLYRDVPLRGEKVERLNAPTPPRTEPPSAGDSRS